MNTNLRSLLATLAVATAALSAPAIAGGGGNVHLDKAPVNLHDMPSLQRGAQIFVNNCLNCHSAQFMRWGHLTQLGLTEDQIKANLAFNPDAKMGDYMTVAMDAKDAKTWFGGQPPDLTLVARVRGSDWLYTFLRSFHVDAGSPTGWNNTVFANVGMPHVLHDLQGSQVKAADGALKIQRAGSMTPAQYDAYVADLVNYLTFMGEPAAAKRTQLGVAVLLFLVMAFFAALLVKHEFWKDVK